jgi:hypothetical protein
LDRSGSLGETWHEITGDSYIVDVRKVKKSKELGYAKAAAEVCKYALKFGDLTVEKLGKHLKPLRVKTLVVIWFPAWCQNP